VIAPDLDALDVRGRTIAYRLREGSSPTLVFLPGYASDMDGTKALALEPSPSDAAPPSFASTIRAPARAAGGSRTALSPLWLEEALAAIDRLTEGPLIVVGSSMGGWIALHFALLRPERVAALVGIAAAPDFTDWGFADGDTAERHGLARGFWESGQQLLLLDKAIEIGCPVRLIHGDADEEVPLDVAFRLMRVLRSPDVQLNVLKGGGHRLSEPRDIDAIVRTVANLLEPAP
jgi:pimeloyl-ACP methyl ester carboxylesterase